jgi:hypothetical protein
MVIIIVEIDLLIFCTVFTVKDCIRKQKYTKTAIAMTVYWAVLAIEVALFASSFEIGKGTGLLSDFSYFMHEHKLISAVYDGLSILSMLYLFIAPVITSVVIFIDFKRRENEESTRRER